MMATYYCTYLGPGPGPAERVRICGQTADTWQCSDVPEGAPLGGPALAFDQQGIAYVAVATDEHMTSGWGELMLRLWSLDTLDPSAAWSSEIVDWTTDLPPIGLRVDPLSGEPVTFHYAPYDPFRAPDCCGSSCREGPGVGHGSYDDLILRVLLRPTPSCHEVHHLDFEVNLTYHETSG